MSRYEFPAKEGLSTLVIGWDRPLNTFFVQVFGPAPVAGADPVEVEWQGTSPCKLPTAAHALRVARIYADLPDNLGQVLETDRLSTLGIADGLAQIALRIFITRHDRPPET
ncbi:hypothetical protein [Novosphingobium sp. BL-52-GroH]|uniref:hypothetical protein n=1 Tax=Novosphingobium sp. BL-52-GroH TaxID=3349877 RepID=UPI00384CE6C6